MSDRSTQTPAAGAYATLKITGDVSRYTRAKALRPGTTSECFLRFSTVAGGRGAAGAERGVRREPKEHYISGMCASATRGSLLGALTFVCALVGPIVVRAEVISVPSAEVVSVPSTDPTNSAASLPLPTVVRGSPPSTARSVPICPPGYTLSPDYDYGCIGPSGGDRQSLPPLNMAELRRRALAAMSIRPP